MKQAVSGRGWLFAGLVVLCVCLFLFGSALASSGIEVDDDGGIWNYDAGTYTDPSGKVYKITPNGVSDDSGSVTVKNDDGSLTVITSDDDPVAGGLVVVSGQIQIKSAEDDGEPISQDEWNRRLLRAAALNGAETPTVYQDPETGDLYAVTVKYMGIGRSMVVLNGHEVLVNTVDLKWETSAPEDQVLGVVKTPNNGYAAMYAGKSKKTTLMKQVRIDSVVRVISTGERWTLVDHDGMRGYVQTSSLEFFCNDHVDFEPGVLSVKGRIKGNDTANIRSRDSKARVLDSYKLGTPLTVFDIIDEWAEVDICGWHCRINSKYLTLVKEVETASAE